MIDEMFNDLIVVSKLYLISFFKVVIFLSIFLPYGIEKWIK